MAFCICVISNNITVKNKYLFQLVRYFTKKVAQVRATVRVRVTPSIQSAARATLPVVSGPFPLSPASKEPSGLLEEGKTINDENNSDNNNQNNSKYERLAPPNNSNYY